MNIDPVMRQSALIVKTGLSMSAGLFPQETKVNPRVPMLAWVAAGFGLVGLYALSIWDLFHGVWGSEEQGQGPIVLAISIWMLRRKWPEVTTSNPEPSVFGGGVVLLTGLLFFLVGRSQDVLLLEVGSSIFLVCAIVAMLQGWKSVGVILFPLFFMIFMVPLPSVFVDAVTQPMKLAVSYVAELFLHIFGYPIARSGVVLQVGQYQLLVADACAGLNTLFSLEALGLLYMNLVRHQSALRNVALAIAIVPISFTANVIRVVVLTLITYHLGDEAGQGFLHGFAGMVLFMAALALIISVDVLLRSISARRKRVSLLA